MLPLNSPANIIRESHRTHMARLEADTARLERKLSRYGWARRSYAMGLDVFAGIACSAAAVLCAVGGVL